MHVSGGRWVWTPDGYGLQAAPPRSTFGGSAPPTVAEDERGDDIVEEPYEGDVIDEASEEQDIDEPEHGPPDDDGGANHDWTY